MKMKFKYECVSSDGYGVSYFGLKKGDLLILIETRLSHIVKLGDNKYYNYEYLLWFPEQKACSYVNREQWKRLLLESEFLGD